MRIHRLLCGFGYHWWARLGAGRRGCPICFQQQRYQADVYGLHGFWMNVMPEGRVSQESAEHPPINAVDPSAARTGKRSTRDAESS